MFKNITHALLKLSEYLSDAVSIQKTSIKNYLEKIILSLNDRPYMNNPTTSFLDDFLDNYDDTFYGRLRHMVQHQYGYIVWELMENILVFVITSLLLLANLEACRLSTLYAHIIGTYLFRDLLALMLAYSVFFFMAALTRTTVALIIIPFDCIQLSLEYLFHSQKVVDLANSYISNIKILYDKFLDHCTFIFIHHYHQADLNVLNNLLNSTTASEIKDIISMMDNTEVNGSCIYYLTKLKEYDYDTNCEDHPQLCPISMSPIQYPINLDKNVFEKFHLLEWYKSKQENPINRKRISLDEENLQVNVEHQQDTISKILKMHKKNNIQIIASEATAACTK